MADVTNIKRRIAKCDLKELAQVIRYAKARQEELRKRDYEHRLADAWKRAKAWAKNDEVFVEEVFVCSPGTFIGGPFQRGDRLEIFWLQPRKKMLWVVDPRDGQKYAFPPKQILRYDLQVDPPKSALPEHERNFAEATAKVIHERF